MDLFIKLQKYLTEKKVGEVTRIFLHVFIRLVSGLESTTQKSIMHHKELADLCGQKEQYFFVTSSKLGCKGQFSEDQFAAREESGHRKLAALF